VLIVRQRTASGILERKRRRLSMGHVLGKGSNQSLPNIHLKFNARTSKKDDAAWASSLIRTSVCSCWLAPPENFAEKVNRGVKNLTSVKKVRPAKTRSSRDQMAGFASKITFQPVRPESTATVWSTPNGALENVDGQTRGR